MKRKPETKSALFAARARFKRTDSEKLLVVMNGAAVGRVVSGLHAVLLAHGIDPGDLDSMAAAVDHVADAKVVHAARALHLLGGAGNLADKKVLAAFYAGIEYACLAIEPSVRGPLEEKARRNAQPRKGRPRRLTLDAYRQGLQDMKPHHRLSQTSRAAHLKVDRETLRRFEREHSTEVAAISTQTAKSAALK